MMHSTISNEPMAEHFTIPPHGLSREEKYMMLIPQLQSLLEGEQDLIANMANLTAVIKSGFDHLWVGFYLVKDQELVLGPYQGPVACTRITYGKGVCGKAWENQQSIVVPDVNAFPGHIACSAASKSEIVIPGILKKKVIFVLDIDSDELNAFNEMDRQYLERIVNMLIDHSDCGY